MLFDVKPEKKAFTRPPRSIYRGQQGAVLLFVVCLLVLVSLIITEFLEHTADAIRKESLLYNRDRLRQTACNALENTLGALHEIHKLKGALLSPLQGWGRPLEYTQFTPPPGIKVEVQIQDETGKLSLERLVANEPMLRELFYVLELGDHAEVLKDSFIDWVRPPSDRMRLNGANSEFYLRRDPPYKTAGVMIRSFDELGLIQGFDEVFFDAQGRPTPALEELKKCVSFYHNQPVNVNTASPILHKVLASGNTGFNMGLVRNSLKIDSNQKTPPEKTYLKERPGKKSSPGAADAGTQAKKEKSKGDDALGKEAGIEAQVFAIRVIVADPLSQYSLRAVVQHQPEKKDSKEEAPGDPRRAGRNRNRKEGPEDQRKPPFKVLEWVENLNEPTPPQNTP